MLYNINTHRKIFSLWAACRAAQAGSSKAKKEELISALHQCGILEFLEHTENFTITEHAFNHAHGNWIEQICQYLSHTYEKTVSYGIAAKLIAVYIKSSVILAGYEETQLAYVAHPPIDSKLLQGIDRVHHTTLSQHYKWQKLDKKHYQELLATLKDINGDCPFWMIERYWNIESGKRS